MAGQAAGGKVRLCRSKGAMGTAEQFARGV